MNKGIIQNGPSNSSASLPELRAKGHLQVEVVLVTRARRQSRYRSTESAGRRRRQGVRRSWSTEAGGEPLEASAHGPGSRRHPASWPPCPVHARNTSGFCRTRPPGSGISVQAGKPPSVDSSHAAERGLAAPGTRARNRRGRSQCGSGDGGGSFRRSRRRRPPLGVDGVPSTVRGGR